MGNERLIQKLRISTMPEQFHSENCSLDQLTMTKISIIILL
jgi:hypothetical protein